MWVVLTCSQLSLQVEVVIKNCSVWAIAKLMIEHNYGTYAKIRVVFSIIYKTGAIIVESAANINASHNMEPTVFI